VSFLHNFNFVPGVAQS